MRAKGGEQPKDRARFYEYSRGSAMECGALFDTLRVMGLVDEEGHRKGKELLVRIVSMLSKMC
ncbi:MAG TPA: four helix bundle protein [Sandaracinaceae bacterium LLY-WYZ-13_1]|nr:four helix bundle protein [Sandaracinaceae bacterium LLY-WYZ-13_1]